MNNQVQIRKITKQDSTSITSLTEELGYPVAVSLVEEQITTILSQNTHFGYVAVLENMVVGYIHGILSIRLTSPPFLEIAGLVVSEAYRGRNIGKELVEYLEKQAKNCGHARVRCNVKRKMAHKFYLSLNYHEIKEQKIFDRKLY